MPNISHFLYKNLIFKMVTLWEHGHFFDILGSQSVLNTWKSYFCVVLFFLSFFPK
jgi:hypothetical protein